MPPPAPTQSGAGHSPHNGLQDGDALNSEKVANFSWVRGV